MIDAPDTSSPADESRLELAVAAAAAERANKPRWIIALGVVLLVIACIFLLVSFSTRSGVLRRVEVERKAAGDVQSLKDQLDLESAKLAARGTAQNPRVGAQIEALAGAMGVVLSGPIGDSTSAAMSQLRMQQHEYNARTQNQDPENVFRWLIATQTSPEMAGLEINRLVFRPGGATAANTPGWNVDVRFSRWEMTK